MIIYFDTLFDFSGGGSIALAGDGGLRQWQITNTVNHLAHVPDSFFAIRFVNDLCWLKSFPSLLSCMNYENQSKTNHRADPGIFDRRQKHRNIFFPLSQITCK